MTTDKTTEYVLLTRYFDPNSGSTGRLMEDLANGLAERGYEMSVITAPEEKRTGESRTEGGAIIREASTVSLGHDSAIGRFLDWLAFSLTTSISLILDWPKSDRELIVVSTPPFLPMSAWLITRLRGWDYTYIVYDVWPDAGVERGYFDDNSFLKTVWSWIHNLILAEAKDVVALGPAMRERIVTNSGGRLSTRDVTIIHNWEDGEHIQPIDKTDNWFAEKHNLVESFTVLYSGNINESHDLETVVNAAARFSDDAVTFLIIGQGLNKESIVRQADRLGILGDTVRFLPYQDFADLPYTLTCGDITVVTKRRRVGIAVSCKIYTTLAAGQPILCIADSASDEAEIVRSSDVGIHVEPGDVEGVVEAINTWRADPKFRNTQSQNARRLFEDRFTRERAIDAYADLLTPR